jgi:DNA-binding transcriptional LysR family regulator
MNIKHMQLLARTIALGSISAAAEEMGMSSSLASRHLANLERNWVFA